MSDKTKTPWGRRKPWIVIGAPLLMISMYMLFLPPENPTLLYFGLWIVLMYLAFTLVDLPYNAWRGASDQLRRANQDHGAARAVSLRGHGHRGGDSASGRRRHLCSKRRHDEPVGHDRQLRARAIPA